MHPARATITTKHLAHVFGAMLGAIISNIKDAQTKMAAGAELKKHTITQGMEPLIQICQCKKSVDVDGRVIIWNST